MHQQASPQGSAWEVRRGTLAHEMRCSGARSRRYKKNEVFLDVVESVNLLVNSNGSVVRSEVLGALKMRTFLSGMPECKLGLNDKVRG